MEGRRVLQLFHGNISFKNSMHGPTLHNDVELTNEDMAILDNLMSEREDAHIARGLGNISTNMAKDDCVIMPTPRSASSR